MPQWHGGTSGPCRIAPGELARIVRVGKNNRKQLNKAVNDLISWGVAARSQPLGASSFRRALPAGDRNRAQCQEPKRRAGKITCGSCGWAGKHVRHLPGSPDRGEDPSSPAAKVTGGAETVTTTTTTTKTRTRRRVTEEAARAPGPSWPGRPGGAARPASDPMLHRWLH